MDLRFVSPCCILSRCVLLGLIAAGGLMLAGCHDTSQPSAKTVTSIPAEPALTPLGSVAKWGTDGKDAIDVAQQLTDNWYIVADGSGSMASSDCSSGQRGGRILDAKQALLHFERQIPASANVGLYVFDEHSNGEIVPLDHGPANRAAYEKAIGSISAGGMTPLGQAIDTAYAALKKHAALQGGYGTYHLVVETDGLPEGGEDPVGKMRAAVEKVVASPIILETIGFCIDDTSHPLKQPGRTIYHDAQNPADLNRDLDAILAEADAFAGGDVK